MTILTPSAEVASMIEYFTEPAIILNLRYQIVASNRAYQQLYGDIQTDGSRLCYQVSHGYRVPCDQAGETCPLKNTLATGQSQQVLHLHHTPRGQEHVDVETCPIRNDNNEIIFLIEIMRKTKFASSLPTDNCLVGRSAPFNQMIEWIHRVAPSDSAVLLLGESGTGKEMVAQAIHQESARAAQTLVTVECSGLSESLFESELFGHEKGAFTGAHSSKLGLVETANKGTLFLDEIGDIPLVLQVKLLRLLETRTFRRVGSIEPRHSDFRLICATHRNLQAMVGSGDFRQDLYYRISTFPIHLPALRERREDIPLLAKTLLTRQMGKQAPELSAETQALLAAYDYPGNIRELRNILEWAGLMIKGNTLLPEHLPEQTFQDIPLKFHANVVQFPQQIIPLDELEQQYLRQLLARYSLEKKELAKQLGVSERTLYRKLQLIEP